MADTVALARVMLTQYLTLTTAYIFFDQGNELINSIPATPFPRVTVSASRGDMKCVLLALPNRKNALFTYSGRCRV